jgi:hypothetical protein
MQDLKNSKIKSDSHWGKLLVLVIAYLIVGYLEI